MQGESLMQIFWQVKLRGHMLRGGYKASGANSIIFLKNCCSISYLASMFSLLSYLEIGNYRAHFTWL